MGFVTVRRARAAAQVCVAVSAAVVIVDLVAVVVAGVAVAGLLFAACSVVTGLVFLADTAGADPDTRLFGRSGRRRRGGGA